MNFPMGFSRNHMVSPGAMQPMPMQPMAPNLQMRSAIAQQMGQPMQVPAPQPGRATIGAMPSRPVMY